MKTAREIYNKYDIKFNYEFNREYYEKIIIKAMEEYASQFKPKEKFNFKQALINYGFIPDLIDEWLQVRKQKRLTNTKTAFNTFIKEIEKSPYEINILFEIIVSKSWGGFENKWIENLNKNNNGKQIGNVASKETTIDALRNW